MQYRLVGVVVHDMERVRVRVCVIKRKETGKEAVTNLLP